MIYTYNINPPVTLINKLLNKYLSHLFLLSVWWTFWHQSSRNICWHCIFVLYCSSVIKGSVASRDVLTPSNKVQRLDSLPSSPLHQLPTWHTAADRWTARQGGDGEEGPASGSYIFWIIPYSRKSLLVFRQLRQTDLLFHELLAYFF